MRACSEENIYERLPALCVFTPRAAKEKLGVCARGPSQVDWINRVMYLCAVCKAGGRTCHWEQRACGLFQYVFVRRKETNKCRKKGCNLLEQPVDPI